MLGYHKEDKLFFRCRLILELTLLFFDLTIQRNSVLLFTYTYYVIKIIVNLFKYKSIYLKEVWLLEISPSLIINCSLCGRV